jgi:hypothetical protein
MASTAMSAAELQPPPGPDGLTTSPGAWLRPAAAAPPGRGLFALALRAASVAWHPDWSVATPPPIVRDPAMALPVVLEAWRATERELAGMTGDSPDQEYLEANAMILQAMYQRLYSERMRR